MLIFKIDKISLLRTIISLGNVYNLFGMNLILFSKYGYLPMRYFVFMLSVMMFLTFRILIYF